MSASLLEWRFLPALLSTGLGLSAIFALGVLLFHLYAAQGQLQPYNEPAGARIGFLEPTLAVVLLFTLAISWLRYGDLVDAIQDETGRMTLLGHAALTLAEPQRSRLVQITADYAAVIAEIEWPDMRHGERAAAASDQLQILTRAYATARAGDAREQTILYYSRQLIQDLAERRETRLAAAAQPLSELLQWVVTAILGATLMLSWFFGLPSLLAKLTLGSLFAFSLGTVLTFNAVLLHAFDGPAALDARAYGDLARELRASLARPQTTHGDWPLPLKTA